MKSKSSSSVKPVYAPQVEAAAGNISSAYNAQAPKQTAITDQLGSYAPGVGQDYLHGNPNVNAAAGYNADVLGGKYLNSNPYFEGQIDNSNNDIRNSVEASLGTRGLTGGSDFAGTIAHQIGINENNMRNTNYNNQLTRMDGAAAQAPGLAAAHYLPLGILQELGQSQGTPVQTAVGAGSGIGGILGQYTNQKQTSSPSIGMLIAQMAGNAAAAYAGKG